MRKTGIFLAVLAVAALAWEGYAIVNDDVALITTTVAEANVVMGGLVSFLIGVLCGHFFWPREKRPGERR